MDTPWEKLAVRLLARWRQDELVAFVSGTDFLAERLADWLADHAGDGLKAEALVEWLLDQEEVDDIFGEDRTIGATLRQEVKALLTVPDEPEETPSPPPAAPVEELSIEEKRAIAREAMKRERAAAEARRVDEAIPLLTDRFGRRPYEAEVQAKDGPANASKFGGTPYLAKGESWPNCENCQQPLALLVQLNLADLPDDAHTIKSGLIQVFYCTNGDPDCEQDCEAWEAGASSTLVRWLDVTKKASAKSSAKAPLAGPEPKTISGWKAADEELPGRYDGRDFVDKLKEFAISWDGMQQRGATATEGDKLWGWPAWPDAPNYPRCPDCHGTMRYLLQLMSDGLCGHRFGASGIAQLYQCVRHPEHVAFNWSLPEE